MKNNINTNKLVYQKPEIALLDLSNSISLSDFWIIDLNKKQMTNSVIKPSSELLFDCSVYPEFADVV